MGSGSSKEVIEIVVQAAASMIPIALQALLAAAPAAAKEKGRVRGAVGSGDDPSLQLQEIIDDAGQDNINFFGTDFKYVYNGSTSQPINYTSGPLYGVQDFLFYTNANPSLNDIQTYIQGVLQPMTAAGYNTNPIALDVYNKVNSLFNAPSSVWVNTAQSYTASTKGTSSKTVEVDLQLYSYTMTINNAPFTMVALNTVYYDAEPLMLEKKKMLPADQASLAAKRATRDQRLKAVRPFLLHQDSGSFLEISQDVAGFLDAEAPDLVQVHVLNVFEVDDLDFGGNAGTKKDKRANWKQLWITNTGQPWANCAAVGCNNPAAYGGHTFYQIYDYAWFITPVCFTHNSKIYDGDNTMTCKRNTWIVQIDPIPLQKLGILPDVKLPAKASHSGAVPAGLKHVPVDPNLALYYKRYHPSTQPHPLEALVKSYEDAESSKSLPAGVAAASVAKLKEWMARNAPPIPVTVMITWNFNAGTALFQIDPPSHTATFTGIAKVSSAENTSISGNLFTADVQQLLADTVTFKYTFAPTQCAIAFCDSAGQILGGVICGQATVSPIAGSGNGSWSVVRGAHV